MSGIALHSLPGPGTCVAILLASYLVLLSYRLLLHPLSKHPGPFYAKLTGWPNWYHATSGNRHLELYRQHRKHGKVVRFAPDKISINSPVALNDIYGSRKANLVKADWYRTLIVAERGGVSTFTAIDRNVHAYKRRMLSHAFSENALKGMEPYILEQIREWCTKLGDNTASGKWSESRNMATMADYLTFDVLGELCYGTSFGMLSREGNRYVADLLPIAVQALYELGYHPWAMVLRRIFLGNPVGDKLGGQMVRDNKRFQDFSKKTMQDRHNLQTEIEQSGDTDSRKDFFSYLFKEKDLETGRGYTEEELHAESNLLIIAGADTSSTTLAAICAYLVRNPPVLAKLSKEIRSTFPELEAIRWSGTELPSLPYLRACIDETLRQSPPVAAHIPREVLPGGAVIDGTFYPAGTVVGVSTYALHHNEEYFPDPFTFSPERWIVDPAAGITVESVALAQSAFCPFSVGSRGCIGKNLAYMELSLAVARMVWLYDMNESGRVDFTKNVQASAGWDKRMEGEYPIKDCWVAQKNGPMVQFRKR